MEASQSVVQAQPVTDPASETVASKDKEGNTPHPQYAAGSPLTDPTGTLTRMFFRTVERFPDKAALTYKREGVYQPISHRELAARVIALGGAMIDLGVEPGDRVAILSENRPEWAVIDLATICNGATGVGIYTTLTPPQIRHILHDCAAKVVFVSERKLLQKILSIRDSLPQLQHVVLIEEPDEEARAKGVLSYGDLLAEGKDSTRGEELERRWKAVQPDDLAALIYTSGTTGEPKGACLTHNNFYSNAHALGLAIKVSEKDSFLSFIPLCHVFARLGNHYLPLYLGATVAFAESIFTVQRNLEEAKPTVMLSVPRLYEAMQERILETAAKAPPMKQRLFRWALKAGTARSKSVRAGRGNPFLALQYAVADRLVLSKIRNKVTGGDLRYFVSGGAALQPALAEFFHAIGVTILEGYGLTETSPVICVNRPESLKIGTVGPPIPGVEVKIAEDGEILSRGPHIMQGYYNRPEDTRQAIDAEGWFHTGDVGRLDEASRLMITDRKKDIIVLATGKNVAPQPIETALKSSPYISGAVLIGDNENVIMALISPNMEALKKFAGDRNLGVDDPPKLAQNQEVRKLIKAEIDRNTGSFADYEKVRKFTLLDHDFTQDPELMTPTLKVKRRAVMAKYAAEIASMSKG